MDNNMKATFIVLVICTLFSLLPSSTSAAPAPTYDVSDFGANPDGETDSANAFQTAWAAVCNSTGRPTVYVGPGRFMIRNTIVFSGRKCKNNGVNFIINGTIVAPADFRALAGSVTWIAFNNVAGVTISGGVLDGQGMSLWACKRTAGKDACPLGFTNLAFTNSMNIAIKGLTSLNSQLFHIVINGCKNVKIQGVKISASGSSPNTDGIHVQFSTGVTVQSTTIGTGDDCISIGAGTTNLWMEKINCGPGHGISIGSLGKDLNEPGVQNVTVKTATFIGTQNGVRIKSWGRASTGYVRDVLFQHITMVNAQNPIIIDQNYCPDHKNCPGEVSGVSISGVTYQDIRGSSATPIAIKFDCSSKNHCTDVKLDNVMLTYNRKPATSACINVGGSTYGPVQPTSCL